MRNDQNFPLLLFLLLPFVMMSCKGKNSLPQTGYNRGMKVPVEVMIVKPQLLLDEIFTTGSILPNEKVELRNEVAGRVTDILFEEGGHVKKGKLLLKINDSDLKAQLSKIEAQEMLIEQEEFRQKKLLEIKAISQEEYDRNYIQLKTIQADKDLILAQIAKTEIYAPFEGKLGLRHVSPGSFLSANSLITDLQQTNPVKIEFTVPEKYGNVIEAGMLISYTTENAGHTFEGKIYAVESSVNPHTRTITARALTQNSEGLIIPGNFARINLKLGRIPDALMVPSEALNTEIDGSFLFIYQRGMAKAVKVETGIRTANDIQITKGIQSGDSLIITGLLQISNGSAVEPEVVSGLVSISEE